MRQFLRYHNNIEFQMSCLCSLVSTYRHHALGSEQYVLKLVIMLTYYLHTTNFHDMGPLTVLICMQVIIYRRRCRQEYFQAPCGLICADIGNVIEGKID